MNNQKLTEEEIKTIQEIQQSNQALVNELGSLEVTKIQIKNRYDELVEYYNELKVKENAFGKELSDKYGNGTIDLEKGEFVPSEQ
jgi:hypothetical protein